MSYSLGPLGPEDRHERIFVRRRGRPAILFVLALLVMAGAAGGAWTLYKMMNRVPPPGEVPLIRADDQPMRKRPESPGGMKIPDRNSLILNHTDPKVEQLLPPPETPLPRPAPPPSSTPTIVESPAAAPPSAVAPAAGSAPPSVAAAPSPPPPAPEPPRAAAAPTPHPVPHSAPAPRAEPAAKPAPVRAPAASKAAEGHGYRLQIGAVRSAEAAKHEWERLRRLHGDVLGSLGVVTPRIDLGSRGTFYRIQAGPVASEATAERDCRELKKRGVGCILVKP